MSKVKAKTLHTLLQKTCNWQRYSAVCNVAVVLVFILLAFNSSYSNAEELTIPTVFPSNGPVMACLSDGGGTNCPSKKYKYYELNDTGMEQMYEQSVEEPCYAKGQDPGCSANDYFNQQIRMNIRYCVGIPISSPETKECWKTKDYKGFPLISHDFVLLEASCWKARCAGYVANGHKNLTYGECAYIQGVRFCARLANAKIGGVEYGNRTGKDPDYRVEESMYREDPIVWTLDNGAELTIENHPVEKNDPITGDAVQIGDAKVTNYTGNWSDLDAGVVYANPSDELVIEGREVDDQIPIYLKKVNDEYKIVTPRLQLCAFEDPIDINDVDPDSQHLHYMTPGTPFLENQYTAYAEMLLVTSAVLYVTVGGSAVVIAAAAALLILAAIQTHVNYVVMQDEGCVDIALSPYPPPYPTILTSPIPMPTTQAVCTSQQTPLTHDCVTPKVAGEYDTFSVPRVRAGFNDVIPLCTDGQAATASAPCVQPFELTSDGEIPTDKVEPIKDEIDAIADPITGETLARPEFLRPSFTILTIDSETGEETYVLSGVMTDDYTDIPFYFTQDPIWKDYTSGDTVPLIEVEDPRVADGDDVPARKFFTCPDDVGEEMCLYEWWDTESPGGNPCDEIEDDEKVRAIDCVERQPLPALEMLTKLVDNPYSSVEGYGDDQLVVSFDTCDDEDAMEAQDPTCSAHTAPLLQATVSDGEGHSQTLIFGTKPTEYMQDVIDGYGEINPIVNNPLVNELTNEGYLDGGYSECRSFYGVQLCAYVTDSEGGSDDAVYVTQKDANGNDILDEETGEPIYETDSNGSPVYESGIMYDDTGYLYGGKKLCLGGYTPPNNMVLARKVLDQGYLNDISTAPADVLVSPYVDGQVISYDDREPASSSDGVVDDTGTVINSDTEGLREMTAYEQDLCIDIPSPAPCSNITFNSDPATNWKTTDETNEHGNANWSSAVPDTSSAGDNVTIVGGTCRNGWVGVPTRTCTVKSDLDSEAFGEWGPVTGACELISCPNDDTTIKSDGDTYDCSFKKKDVFHADNDSCSYKPPLSPTQHRDRTVCCTSETPSDNVATHGIWTDPYPSANTPPADCDWEEEGKLPYLVE